MTTNDPVATVRAALAAAVWQGPGDNRDRTDGCRLIDANAPTWLAQLCDEIERLRADIKEEVTWHDTALKQRDVAEGKVVWLRYEYNTLLAASGEALEEIERLRRKLGGYSNAPGALYEPTAMPSDERAAIERSIELEERNAALCDEVDGWKRTATEVTVLHEAALAEVERLRAVKFRLDLQALTRIAELEDDLAIANHRGDEWRAKYNADTDAISAWRACADQLAARLADHPCPWTAYALDEYERLKAGTP